METVFLGLQHGGGLLPLQPPSHLLARELPMLRLIRRTPELRRRRRSPLVPAPVAGKANSNRPESERAAKLKATSLEKTVQQYRDNWFDRLALGYLSSSLQATIGGEDQRLRLEGYDRLVEAAAIISTRHGAKEQQEMVIQALKKAFPDSILSMIRILVPPSKFSRQLFATFTTIFFSWMVGPCEVRESEFQGKKEKNVVYIRKCRFLEATNCVGMCTNLCKLPSQKFIDNSLGMPTYMVPNFEDQSCEIIFGQHPTTDDPALKQPCYQTSCIAKQRYQVNCSS